MPQSTQDDLYDDMHKFVQRIYDDYTNKSLTDMLNLHEVETLHRASLLLASIEINNGLSNGMTNEIF